MLSVEVCTGGTSQIIGGRDVRVVIRYVRCGNDDFEESDRGVMVGARAVNVFFPFI